MAVSLLLHKSLADCGLNSVFQRAVVYPCFRKVGLDASQRKNYRPVSNLSCLSKLLESVVQVRLSDFRPEVEIWPFRSCAVKTCNLAFISELVYGADTMFHRIYFLLIINSFLQH